MSSSSLESLSPEILEHIAFLTVADWNHVNGPPKELVPLLCTSRTIYRVLSSSNNLLASIFRLKFDCAAPTRRLGARWVTSSCLAFELKKRFAALQRIRRKICTHTDDLWTAYLLMMESDGRNEAQLIEWARVEEYLHTIIAYRVHAVPESPHYWFTETEGTSLIIWLLWMTSSRGEFSSPLQSDTLTDA